MEAVESEREKRSTLGAWKKMSGRHSLLLLLVLLRLRGSALLLLRKPPEFGL